MQIVNAEQIKTNIEACIERECENCSYCEQTACKETMLCDTLALINSQEQRIKELTEENERLRADDSELLNEFMNWLQDNKHINKSVEYRNELCEMFINDRRLNK